MSMRRWLWRALLLLLLLAVGVPFWALGSASGLRTMLALASRLSSAGSFTVAEATGSLGEGARLVGVSFKRDGLELKLDRLSLQVDLEALLRRELHVQQIALGRLQIGLPPEDPASPPLASLPALPRLPLGIRLDELTLDTLDISPADGSPLRFTRVAGALRWPRGGALGLRELSLSHARSDFTAAGRWGAQAAERLALELHWRHQLDEALFVQGSGQLEGAGARFQLTQDLVAPVRAHLDARLELPVGAAPWSVTFDLPAGQALPGLPADLPLEELAATVRAAGAADGEIEASVVAELGLGTYGRWTLETQAAGRSPAAIGLQRLRLTGPGEARVDLHGEVDATARTAALSGEWRAVRWPLGGAPLVDVIVEHSHSCYLGDRKHRHAWGWGCGSCPACELRARGWERYSGSGKA
jgi:autotransporter translocation and assembly factor TamB